MVRREDNRNSLESQYVREPNLHMSVQQARATLEHFIEIDPLKVQSTDDLQRLPDVISAFNTITLDILLLSEGGDIWVADPPNQALLSSEAVFPGEKYSVETMYAGDISKRFMQNASHDPNLRTAEKLDFVRSTTPAEITIKTSQKGKPILSLILETNALDISGKNENVLAGRAYMYDVTKEKDSPPGIDITDPSYLISDPHYSKDGWEIYFLNGFRQREVRIDNQNLNEKTPEDFQTAVYIMQRVSNVLLRWNDAVAKPAPILDEVSLSKLLEAYPSSFSSHREALMQHVSSEQAEQMFGEDFLGPETVEKSLGLVLRSEDVPLIPFTLKELEQGKRLEQFLVLRWAQAEDGSPLTMERIVGKVEKKWNERGVTERTYAGNGSMKLLINENPWFQKEPFFTGYPIQSPHWALVTKDVLPETLGKNYLEQTRLIALHLMTNIFQSGEMPNDIVTAIEEFASKEDYFKKKLSKDESELVKGLAGLSINTQMRRSPSEVIYDAALYFERTGRRLLEKNFDTTTAWFKTDMGSYHFICVGPFYSGGLEISGSDAYSGGYKQGVSLSRK